MKKFIAIVLILGLIFPLSACKKKENLDNLSKDLTTYEIDLTYEDQTKRVTGTQNVTYINNTGSVLKTIKFHLYPQFFEEGATHLVVSQTKTNSAYPNGMSYANYNVDRVCVDSIEKTVVYENDFNSILSVELNNSLLPEERANILIEFSFTLPNCYHRFGYGENTINLANFYPIVCVFENGNFNTSGYHPNGDPFYSDMANYSVNINLDRQYIVAGTGNKTETTLENNTKNVSFSANLVRDFALILSNKFQVVKGQFKHTNIEYYYFNDTNPNKSLKAGIDSIKTFSELFGTYPYSTFSIVESDFVYGGMEYPNLVMINSEIENKDDYMNVIIHETAHQWWYGMVGNDEFSTPWLDEALTEFSTILFYDYNSGYNLSHNEMINSSKENFSVFVSVYEDVLGSIDTSMRSVNQYSTEPEYTYCIYVKGVLMFESLYQLIGEKDFVKSLKNYFENNKYTNSQPEDLFLAFSETTNKDLTNFFDSWIKGKVIIR